MHLFLLILTHLHMFSFGNYFRKQSHGEVWPKPRHETKKKAYYVLGSESDHFRVTKPNYTCYILDEGIKRLLLQNLAQKQNFIRRKGYKPKYNRRYYKGTFGPNTEFRVELTRPCEDDEYPYLEMDETYKLTVGERILLSSASVWGILRGLETFNHLLYFSADDTELRINATKIADYPAYPHRGLLIDTGRHYLQPGTILRLLDTMEMNKMNVLHWHIVDDESFPYQSEQLPRLSLKGAFHPSLVYTREDIEDIIEHARLAGIRVIPEFDAPGHVRSWGAAFPDILTACYDKDDNIVAYGSLDPISNTTHIVLKQLYQEVTELFPDDFIHLGGDAVDTQCWLSNLKIHNIMKHNRVKNIEKLLKTEFMAAVSAMLPPRTKHIVWQEVFDDGVPLSNKTIVQVWKKCSRPAEEIINVLKSGNHVLFSSSWCLDDVSVSWDSLYVADPRQMVHNSSWFSGNISSEKLDRIVGGEACMWGTMVDDTNIFSRIWPRTCAVAERLWSGADYKSPELIAVTSDTRRRMEEQVCRMRQRDIPAGPPNGPGYCIGPVSKRNLKKLAVTETAD